MSASNPSRQNTFSREASNIWNASHINGYQANEDFQYRRPNPQIWSQEVNNLYPRDHAGRNMCQRSHPYFWRDEELRRNEQYHVPYQDQAHNHLQSTNDNHLASKRRIFAVPYQLLEDQQPDEQALVSYDAGQDLLNELAGMSLQNRQETDEQYHARMAKLN